MNTRENQSWRKRHPILSSILLVAAIACVSLLVFTLLMYIFIGQMFKTRTEAVDMATVSGWVHVELPTSAKLQNSLGIRHFLDYELYAEVEVNQKDLELFIASLKKDSATLSRKNRMKLTNTLKHSGQETPIPKWWNPDSAKSFIACEVQHALLLISMDNPNKATIWIHYDTDGHSRY